MKFRIILKRTEGFLRLAKITRSKTGLYLISMSPAGGPDNHFSYHEDGVCFQHALGRRLTRSYRQPLSSLKGIETIGYMNLMLFTPMPEQRIIREEDMQGEDVLIERHGWFGIEIMISDVTMKLPPLEGRLNSELFVKEHMRPKVLIECFNLPVKGSSQHGIGLPPRFPSSAPIKILSGSGGQTGSHQDSA